MQAIVSADAKLARAVSHDRRCIRLASFSARGQWEPGEARTSWAGGSSTGPKTDQGPGCLNAPAREPERQYGAAPCGGASELAEENLLCARPPRLLLQKSGRCEMAPAQADRLACRLPSDCPRTIRDADHSAASANGSQHWFSGIVRAFTLKGPNMADAQIALKLPVIRLGSDPETGPTVIQHLQLMLNE